MVDELQTYIPENLTLEQWRDLGRRLEVLMDTVALLGVAPRDMPPAYRQSWAELHTELKAALGPGEGR